MLNSLLHRKNARPLADDEEAYRKHPVMILVCLSKKYFQDVVGRQSYAVIRVNHIYHRSTSTNDNKNPDEQNRINDPKSVNTSTTEEEYLIFTSTGF